ncbi:galactoside 2-alpha-L-fucosyltransferase 3-like [Argonauta hians]
MNRCKYFIKNLLKLAAFFIAFVLISSKFLNERSAVKLKDCINRNKVNHICPQNCSHNVTKRRNVCLNLVGRLGNNLFQLASALGIARAKGMQLVLLNNTHFKFLNSIIRISSLPVSNSCPQSRIRDEKNCGFSDMVFKYPNDRDYLLYGYYQSWLYFIFVEPEVRSLFSFKSFILKKAHDILSKIIHTHRGKYSLSEYIPLTLVGVHVRRGDLLKKKAIKYGYKIAPASYFKKAMDYYRKHFQNIIFIVCSDNIGWSATNLGHESTYYVHDKSYIDLAVLSLCNHSIMSVGSYSWWAAWLANGQTVYYPYPFQKNSALQNKFSEHKHDYFPFHWLPMDIPQ